jgi:hypothetical protein
VNALYIENSVCKGLWTCPQTGYAVNGVILLSSGKFKVLRNSTALNSFSPFLKALFCRVSWLACVSVLESNAALGLTTGSETNVGDFPNESLDIEDTMVH